MICKSCGKHITDDSKFCNYCGTKIRIADSAKSRQDEEKEFANALRKEIDRNAAEEYITGNNRPSGTFVVWVYDTTVAGENKTVVEGIVTAGEVHVDDVGVIRGRSNEKYRIKEIERLGVKIQAASRGMHVLLTVIGSKNYFKKYDYLCNIESPQTTGASHSNTTQQQYNGSDKYSSQQYAAYARNTSYGTDSPIFEYKSAVYGGIGQMMSLIGMATIRFYTNRIDYVIKGEQRTLVKMKHIYAVDAGEPVYLPFVTQTAAIWLKDGTGCTIACPKGVYDQVVYLINQYKR